MFEHEKCLNNYKNWIKGAPGSDCRTYTRLVSPAIGREKKMEPPIF